MAATGKIFSLPIATTLSENSVIFAADKSKVASSLNDLKFLKLNWINMIATLPSFLYSSIYTFYLKSMYKFDFFSFPCAFCMKIVNQHYQ